MCASLLASGSYDKSITLLDCLSNTTPVVATYRTNNMIDNSTGMSILNSESSDIESMQWNPFNEHELLISFENGYVACIDKRNANAFSYCFKAHEKTVSSVSYSKEIPGMLCTASIDKTVKIWDINTVTKVKNIFTHSPVCLAYKTMGVGKILSMDYSYINTKKKDTEPREIIEGAVDRKITNTGGYLIACGGDSNDGAPAVWYSDELLELTNHFTYKTHKEVSVAEGNNNSNVNTTDENQEQNEIEKEVKSTKKKNKSKK